MSILLTHYSGECVEEFGQPCSDWCDGYDEGAKAQLKKVVEEYETDFIFLRELIANRENNRAISYMNFLWKALLKEVE